jgi:hypothetical protein
VVPNEHHDVRNSRRRKRRIKAVKKMALDGIGLLIAFLLDLLFTNPELPKRKK